MNLHVAICDDQRQHSSQLEELLMTYLSEIQGMAGSIEMFESGKSLLADMERTAYDIIFLDIEMPGFNGIEIAEMIRLKDTKVLIIYVTSHTSYMKRSFEIQPFRYLLKPIDEQELKLSLFKAVEQCLQRSNVLSFSSNHTYYHLRVTDIIYITVERGKKLMLVTERESYSYYGKLGELEEKLRIYGYCRIHTGYLVNWSYVCSIKKDEIALKNGVTLPISRSRSADALLSYHAFIEMRLLR